MERQAFAEIGKRLLHFFTVFVLGFDRLGGVGSFHWDVCNRLKDPQRWQFHLYYRGAFKSTIVSIARPLWGAAKDPATYDHIHLVSDAPLGLAQLQAIAKQCEHNNVLRTLYPGLKPNRKVWKGTVRSIMGRDMTQVGPTWELRTTRQPMAGRHVRAFTVDDIVNEINYKSRDEQDKLSDYLRRLPPALDTDEFMMSGTLYADYDAWSVALREWWPDLLDVFVQPVRGTAHLEADARIVHDTEEGYAHPEEWNESVEKAKRKAMKDVFIFQSQYMLDTSQPDSLGLNPKWIKRWEVGKTLPALTHYLAADPASGDADRSKPAIAMVGIDEAGDLYMMFTEEFEDEGEMIDALFRAAKLYKPLVVGVERYAQGGWGTWNNIQGEMGKRNEWLPLEKLTMGATAKTTRIREALRPHYHPRWGRMWHLPDMEGGEYEAQMQRFPGGVRLDHLDAGAWAVWLAAEHGFQGPSLQEAQVAERERRGEAVTVEQIMEDMLHPEERDEATSDFW